MKNLIFSLILISLVFVLVNVAFAQRKAISAAEATGTFSTGKEDSNEMKILPLGGGKLKVEFALIYAWKMANGEWMANVGDPSGIAEIKGDRAILDLSEDNRICKITMKFVKPGVVKVTQGDNCSGIVGGLNVSSFGTYKRTSAKKPKFSN